MTQMKIYQEYSLDIQKWFSDHDFVYGLSKYVKFIEMTFDQR